MGHFSFHRQQQSRYFDRGQGVESNYLKIQAGSPVTDILKPGSLIVVIAGNYK